MPAVNSHLADHWNCVAEYHEKEITAFKKKITTLLWIFIVSDDGQLFTFI